MTWLQGRAFPSHCNLIWRWKLQIEIDWPSVENFRFLSVCGFYDLNKDLLMAGEDKIWDLGGGGGGQYLWLMAD